MTLHRRDFVKLGLAAAAMPAFLRQASAEGFALQASDWRGYALTTRVQLPQGGPAQIWLPVPETQGDYQRVLGSTIGGNATLAEIVTDPSSGAQMLYARFDAGATPELTVETRVDTRNRVVDWNAPAPTREDPAVLQAALVSSSFKPLDGQVAELAAQITAGMSTDRGKIAAIYAWIVANCHRDMEVPGCGSGDIVATLAADGHGGKCADLNGLFVGLARASGVPARDVYGVRVAPSASGYKQLGANKPDVTGAQHCRAEVYLSEHGWVAMDPADVLKVMRAETDRWIKDPADPLVAPVNAALMGNWEGNWVAYNAASDVTLPGAEGRLPFLMYPQGLDSRGRLNELDAKPFSYQMTAKAL